MFSCHLTAVLSKRLLQSQVFLSVFPLKQVRTAFKSHLVYRYLSIMSEERKPFERLPANVVPRNYNLSLQPDLQKFVFSGSEVVSVEVTKATSQVVLNCLDISISSAKFTAGDVDLTAADINYSKDDETATLVFPSDLPVGNGDLHLDFTGELNDKMKGFYRSKYMDDGKEKHCAVTQFEPTDARRAFPCWDEPALKATFDVTLVVPKDLVALSNMNVIEEKPAEDASLKTVKYAPTPIMSTYLLAFVVGEYDYVEDKDQDGVLVRVYTPKGKAVQGQFALEVAVKTLPFYKEYFGISYPLPKMDLIAIADFAAGAMENWGLVTYRETALLIDPENSSSAAKQWVALVVGHEIAHQWFGNLVTMEWWTHLWLNEGFATWIEYLCVDHCFPKYDIWTQFVTTDLSRGMDLDALKNSHPIEVPVGHPAEIDEIFDAISYSKGASVIRMLHHYIGDKDFRAGLNQYLNKFKYKNAFTEDLWEYLGNASGKPVANIMTSWTKQMGFPVISVKAQQKGDDKELTIVQKKFCADGSSEGTDQLWHVPISAITSTSTTDPVASTLLEQQSCSLLVKGSTADQWVKLNPGQVGFYRVQYESDMLELLLPAIKDLTLPPRDRLGLQSDLYALARASLVPTTDFLKVVEAYSSEVNYTVWNDMSSNLASISLVLQYTDFYKNFGDFCLSLYKPIADKLGWEPQKGEGHLDALLRGLVINRLGKYGHEATVKEAQRRFDAHCKKESTVDADLRSAVYSIVLEHGDEATLDAVEKLFKEADLHEERVRLMRCMGKVTQPELIKRVLKFAVSDDVRSQDTVFVIGGVTGSVTGRDLAWSFVKENWTDLYDRYEGGFLLSRLVKCTTENFASEEKAKEIEEFFAKNSVPSAERTVQQSLESVRLNISWLSRDSAATKAWLQSKGF